MAGEGTSERLVGWIKAGRQAEQDFVANLSESERKAVGTLEKWSAKDNLVHINFWKERQVEQLQALRLGQTPEDYDNYLEMNDQTFLKYQNNSWEEVQALVEEITWRVIALVAEIPEDELVDKERYPWLKGKSLAHNIFGGVYWHPVEHIASYYRQNGKPELSMQIAEKLAEAQIEMDSSAKGKGVAYYNLACAYAQTGYTLKAIPLLRQSLELHPDLMDWSRKDSDLEPLHGLPEYEALYSNPVTE